MMLTTAPAAQPACRAGGSSRTVTSTTRTLLAAAPRAVGTATGRFGGGGVMDRPADSGVDVTKKSGWDSDRDSNLATLPRPDTGRDGGSTDRQKGSPPGGGNHRLLLLKSPQHKESQVVKSLTQVVPNCDEQHAQNCFSTSQQLGMAIVTSCLKEHAEFYMQQLYRYGVKTAIEPDNTTA